MIDSTLTFDELQTMNLIKVCEESAVFDTETKDVNSSIGVADIVRAKLYELKKACKDQELNLSVCTKNKDLVLPNFKSTSLAFTNFTIERLNMESSRANFSRKLSEHLFVIDSGASKHMTPLRYLLKNFKQFTGTVRLGNDITIASYGYGNIGLFKNVLYVPKLTLTLITVSELDRLKYHASIY
jgi:hypothetical protein